ncbi:MAG: chlorite dismutase family protein [Elusimicrobiales bacterium]|nr:chlorite dismutase family protein [Elusimicrobiales bacterium]
MSNNVFSIFTFIKLSNEFKHLELNSRIALKQEFEDAIANCQEKIFLRTYAISNLKEDCDILMWRMHHSLDFLQEICTKILSAGIGKYMEIKYTYIGFKNFNEQLNEINQKIGIYPYLLLHPLIKHQTWYELVDKEREKLIEERKSVIQNYSNLLETIFESFGIDDQDMIVTREAKKLIDLIDCTSNLKKLKNKSYTLNDKPVFLCIGKDLRYILDMLG